MQSPPYLKRAAVILLILGAIAWDLHSGAVEPFPTAATPIAAGTPISDDLIAWVDLPRDRIPLPRLTNAVAARDIGIGEPLTPALLAGQIVAPQGWWTVPLEIGALAVPGDEVLLVISDPLVTTTGLVVVAQSGDRYTTAYRPAAVAVAPDVAPIVAAAEREDRLITAVRAPQTGS